MGATFSRICVHSDNTLLTDLKAPLIIFLPQNYPRWKEWYEKKTHLCIDLRNNTRCASLFKSKVSHGEVKMSGKYLQGCRACTLLRDCIRHVNPIGSWWTPRHTDKHTSSFFKSDQTCESMTRSWPSCQSKPSKKDGNVIKVGLHNHHTLE